MGAALYKVDYKHLEDFGQEHTNWLEHYMESRSADDGLFIFVDLELLCVALAQARADQTGGEFAVGHEFQDGSCYKLDPRITDEVEHRFRRAIKDNGDEFGFDVNIVY